MLQPAPTLTKAPPVHLNFLDGLRALAAIYVSLSHAVQHVIISDPISRILDYPFRRGHYAVVFFIVMSGFCLMLPVTRNAGQLRGGVRTFLWKRAWRILPPYFVAMGIALLLILTLIPTDNGTIWEGALPVRWVDIWAHVLLVQDVFLTTHAKINYALWSIAVEWRIYFLFPLILLAWKRWNPFAVTMGVILLSFVVRVLLNPLQPTVYLGLTGINPHFLGLFVLGMLAAELAFGDTRFRSRIPYKPVLVVTTISIIAGDLVHLNSMLVDMLIGLAAATLLLGITAGKFRRLKQLLSWKPLVFVGTFAYSLYLMHPPLLQLITQYAVVPLGLSPTAQMVLQLTAGTGVIVAVSYLFFLIAERPFTSQAPVKSA